MPLLHIHCRQAHIASLILCCILVTVTVRCEISSGSEIQNIKMKTGRDSNIPILVGYMNIPILVGYETSSFGGIRIIPDTIPMGYELFQ